MPSTARERSDTKAPRLVLHHPKLYDFTVWLMTLGRERAFARRSDVGCGTGSLAIAAKRHLGPTGIVKGIDASPEMIARAEKKAARARARRQMAVSTARSDGLTQMTDLAHAGATFNDAAPARP
jgi:trans-aconitate methyltransferase